MNSPVIRDAASLILHRNISGAVHVLMGQRGQKAAFMPNKFVFPGGAVDLDDVNIPLMQPMEPACQEQLLHDCAPELARALPVAAIRELWEEAGLILGSKAEWKTPPKDWETYAQRGYRPSAEGFRFVFRAVTPIGPKRRFDARFFLVDAENLESDPDDFSAASDELSHLQWIELSNARSFDLPFITEVVLAEVEKHLKTGVRPSEVPYFKATDKRNIFTRIPSVE
ncbi:NUDIX hydrolase [Halocynthiibacter sp. C4]|uniref:NUDIX hydrolase n=1 Tax=Halocynthiibacter sp. C4 TaxID=2992758 RepID=UPI00237A479F|nr:NUDIX hydrolase [Halocynthiibacter sp. C4]MDE0588986.1 NUDIX hydrolase [Halocynthiibacter sp. C4]